jgi:hypothetical protein
MITLTVITLSSFQVHVSFCWSVNLNVCLSILSMSLSIYVIVYLCHCLSMSLSIYVIVCLCHCLSMLLSVYVIVYLCHCLSVSLSIYVIVCLCHCLSMSLSVYVNSICFVIQIRVSRIIVMCHHPFSRNLKVKLLFFIFPGI